MTERFDEYFKRQDLELRGQMEMYGCRLLCAFQCIYCGRIFDDLNNFCNHSVLCKNNFKHKGDKNGNGRS